MKWTLPRPPRAPKALTLWSGLLRAPFLGTAHPQHLTPILLLPPMNLTIQLTTLFPFFQTPASTRRKGNPPAHIPAPNICYMFHLLFWLAHSYPISPSVLIHLFQPHFMIYPAFIILPSRVLHPSLTASAAPHLLALEASLLDLFCTTSSFLVL